MYTVMNFRCPHCGNPDGTTKKIHHTFIEGEVVEVRGRCRECGEHFSDSFTFRSCIPTAEEAVSNTVQ